MKIICRDGTAIQCQRFEAIDSGVLLFADEADEEDEDREAVGFIPVTELRYVLPDEIAPGAPGLQRLGQPERAPVQQTPPGGQPQMGQSYQQPRQSDQPYGPGTQ